MSCILYYSNYCQHSAAILQTVSKSNIKDQIHFVCIDKRERLPDGQIALILENQQKVILPTNVTKVPALLLISQNYKVIFGDDILSHLNPTPERPTQANQMTSQNMINEEPSCYSLSGNSLLSGVVSDQFSFIDMSSDDLSAKGSGGLRQMYNYATLDTNDKIATPDEDYVPNKASDSDLEKYQQERNAEMPQNKPPNIMM